MASSPLKSGLLWSFVERKHTRAFLKAARSLQECVAEWYQVDAKGAANAAGLADLTDLAATLGDASSSPAAQNAALLHGAVRSPSSALGVLELFDGLGAALEVRAYAKIDAAWTTLGAVQQLQVEVLAAMEDELATMQMMYDSGVLSPPRPSPSPPLLEQEQEREPRDDDLECPVLPSDIMEWLQDVLHAFRAEGRRKAKVVRALRHRLGDVAAMQRAVGEWPTSSKSSAIERAVVDQIFSRILGT